MRETKNFVGQASKKEIAVAGLRALFQNFCITSGLTLLGWRVDLLIKNGDEESFYTHHLFMECNGVGSGGDGSEAKVVFAKSFSEQGATSLKFFVPRWSRFCHPFFV